jgi:hypothetical protein
MDEFDVGLYEPGADANVLIALLNCRYWEGDDRNLFQLVFLEFGRRN